MFATVALDTKCFSPIQAREGERRRGREAEPRAASDVGHYADLNGFPACLKSPVREEKTRFPLRGLVLVFIVSLHTGSTNVTDNGLDVRSRSLLFLSLHPSFSLLFQTAGRTEAATAAAAAAATAAAGRGREKKEPTR